MTEVEKIIITKDEYEDLVNFKQQMLEKRERQNKYYRDKYANNTEYRKTKQQKNREGHMKRRQAKQQQKSS
tara:strand:+ start:331 stop:543 length:213 start_codon:yes stop_codon:yes gene_type:complete